MGIFFSRPEKKLVQSVTVVCEALVIWARTAHQPRMSELNGLVSELVGPDSEYYSTLNPFRKGDGLHGRAGALTSRPWRSAHLRDVLCFKFE